MAVHRYKRADGTVCYSAAYYGPDGRRRVEQVGMVPQNATKAEHKMARQRAALRAGEQRAAVRNGDWIDPNASQQRAIAFDKLVEVFLENYRTSSGSMNYYIERTKLLHCFPNFIPGCSAWRSPPD